MNAYNFTERVRRVLAMAREEAGHLHHEYVGTEHILLAVLREGEGVASAVIANLDGDPDVLRQRALAQVSRGKASGTTGPELPYTSRAKRVLELSMKEARDLHHSYVGTEHLLLGLIAEEKGIGAQTLIEAGITLEAARAETLRILGVELPPEQRSAPDRPPAPRADALAALGNVYRPLRAMLDLAIAAGDTAEPLGVCFTPRAADALRGARLNASRRGHSEVSPAELLHVLLRQGGGMAALLFERLHVEVGALASEIEAGLAASAAAPPAEAPRPFHGTGGAPGPRASEATRAALAHALALATSEWRLKCDTHDLVLGVLYVLSAQEADACARAGLTRDAFQTEQRRVTG